MMIQMRGIQKVYNTGHVEVRALKGIDLEVDRSEYVAVVGPSGSGKSTLMNLLGCLDTPTAGSYRFAGVEVGGLSRDQRALLRRHYLGFVFQGYNLLGRTSALENVELPLVYRGASRGRRRALAREALAAVGLAGTSLSLGLIGLISILPLEGEAFDFLGNPTFSPAIAAATALILGTIGTGAGYFPARRAASVEPAVSLRYE